MDVIAGGSCQAGVGCGGASLEIPFGLGHGWIGMESGTSSSTVLYRTLCSCWCTGHRAQGRGRRCTGRGAVMLCSTQAGRSASNIPEANTGSHGQELAGAPSHGPGILTCGHAVCRTLGALRDRRPETSSQRPAASSHSQQRRRHLTRQPTCKSPPGASAVAASSI
jgi:hypothetical protein